MQFITNTLIKELYRLHNKKGRDYKKQFLCYGENTLKHAQVLGKIEYVIVQEKDYLYYSKIVSAKILYVATESQFAHLAEIHTDVIIVNHFFELPVPKRVDRILILDDVQDPRNVGSLIRSAVAFNYDVIFLSNNSVDKYNLTLVQASQGSIFNLPIIKGNIFQYIQEIKANRFKIIGTDLHKSNTFYTGDKIEKYALILGNEGHGISKEISDLCDTNLLIDIENIDSLSVNVAGGILLYILNKLQQK